MAAAHAQDDFRQFRQRGVRHVGRVVVLGGHQPQVRAALLHQRHHVLVFRDQAFEAQGRIALVDLAEHGVEGFRLERIGQHHGQPGLQAFGQLAGAAVQAIVGREHLQGLPQQDPARLGQRRLPLAAVEQRDVQVHFQVGDGFADGGLAFSQLAGGRGEGAFRSDLGESRQGFQGVAHGWRPVQVISEFPMDSIFMLPEISWKIASTQ
ncbi:hypothetical protein FQZ97_510150 [compost metagenome]